MELRPNKEPRRAKTKTAVNRKNQAEARPEMNSEVLACGYICQLLLCQHGRYLEQTRTEVVSY